MRTGEFLHIYVNGSLENCLDSLEYLGLDTVREPNTYCRYTNSVAGCMYAYGGGNVCILGDVCIGLVYMHAEVGMYVHRDWDVL